MWTARGLVDVYLLVFLHPGSRRVWISPSTVQPDSAWVSLQARNFLMVAEDMSLSPEYLMRDNDVKFSRQFDDVFKTSGVEIKRTVPMSPNLRAHVERFIQTLKFECLNKFVIVAEKHLDHICRIWSRHYNEERPHSSRDHLPPNFTAPPEEATTIRVSDIVCTSKLGGVIHSCSRRAAWSHRIQVQISNWAALNGRADWNFLRHSPLKPCIDSLDAATDR
ncbi:MAG: integrase core domain-containing protein [Planctomyces sp.]